MRTAQEEKIETIAHHFGKIMEALGLDISRSPLAETPVRFAKMYVNELFKGLDPDNFPRMSYFDPPSSEMVLVKEISVESMCEHHFVPISGKASVAYLPNKKLLGLSKIPRLVDYFCRRPQLQERLTSEIASSLSLLLETEDVAVLIEAKHSCVSMRGIKDASSLAVTTDLRGKFRSDPIFAEQFFSVLTRSSAENH